MGGVIKICKAKPIKYLRVVKTLVYPQILKQVFRRRR